MPPKLHQLQNVAAHEGNINSMCLGHRTAQIFATGGEDRFLKLWSIGSNNPRSSFGPFQSHITACRFNSTEEMIVCANNSGTVMLFDLNENLCSSNWTSHHSTVRCLSFHTHDPRLILTCGIDGKFNVLSTTQRAPIQSYNAHTGPVNYVACSYDGNLAATCGDDKTIRIFDITAQQQIIKFDNAHTDSISCVQFHPTEPLLISCGADRMIRFWDLQNEKEIPTSFSLDSSPIDIVMFAPYSTPSTYDVAISASSDYLRISGWKPPEMYDTFALGLERVHDIAIDNNSNDEGTLTIASSSEDTALIYRMLLNQLKPFSSKKSQTDLGINNEPERQKSQPRLLDLTTMTKAKSKTKVTQPSTTTTTKNASSKRTKPNITSSSSGSSMHPKPKPSTNSSTKSSGRSSASSKSNRSVSSGTKKSTSTTANESDNETERRSNSSGSRTSRSSTNSTVSKRSTAKPSYASEQSDELKIFKDFRKYRGPFITQMNERYARLSRVKDSLAQLGLTKTLENAAETGELGSELLVILGMKPKVVKLEHATLMMQISVKVFDRDYDLAILTVESMLQAFGKLVNVTRQTSLNGVGSDYALEERKKKSDTFVDAFREIAPKMRTVACGKSQISQTAAEILEQWKFFLR